MLFFIENEGYYCLQIPKKKEVLCYKTITDEKFYSDFVCDLYMAMSIIFVIKIICYYYYLLLFYENKNIY